EQIAPRTIYDDNSLLLPIGRVSGAVFGAVALLASLAAMFATAVALGDLSPLPILGELVLGPILARAVLRRAHVFARPMIRFDPAKRGATSSALSLQRQYRRALSLTREDPD